MTPIGGYFELETSRGELPCEGGVAVNFGRGGLEFFMVSMLLHG